MAKPLSEELKQQWKERILEQRRSGISIPKWCSQHHVPLYNFRYWQGKLFPRLFERSTFTEVVSQKDNPKIFLEWQGVKIHLSPGFDPQILMECLEVVKKC